MVKQVEVQGEHIIPLLNGCALVASKSEWGGWHVVKNGRCDCKGYQHRGTCRHVKAVESFQAPKVEPVPAAVAPAPAATPPGPFLPERTTFGNHTGMTLEELLGFVPAA